MRLSIKTSQNQFPGWAKSLLGFSYSKLLIAAQNTEVWLFHAHVSESTLNRRSWLSLEYHGLTGNRRRIILLVGISRWCTHDQVASLLVVVLCGCWKHLLPTLIIIIYILF